jgi:hypothetical protein
MWLSWVYGGAMALVGLAIISAPLPVLLDRFIPDDAFYYHNTARIFAQTGYSSFDGLHFTNGYQPLWFLINTAVFCFFPGGGELPLRVLLSVQLALSLAGALILFKALGQRFGAASALIASIVWVIVMYRVTLNGLETALVTFLYSLLFALYLNTSEDLSRPLLPRRLLQLGMVSGLLFLARTDMLFLVFGISVELFIRSRYVGLRGVKDWIAWYALPVGVLVGVYLASNLFFTGHLMPVSGAAKVFHSEVARQSALTQHGSSRLALQWANVRWLFILPNFRFLLVGVFGPWLLVVLSHTGLFTRTLQDMRRLWPFALGATLSWLFYSLVFYGGFTQTLWYYAPHTLLSCFTIVYISHAFDRWTLLKKLPCLTATLIVGMVLGWVSIYQAILFAGTLIVGTQVLGRLTPPRSRSLQTTLWLLCGTTWILLYGLLAVQQRPWLLAVGTILILIMLLHWFGTNVPLRLYGAVLIFLITMAVYYVNIRSDLKAPPRHWNYHLYLGAQWARDNTPLSATIWSGSAGILGYFSGRTVVNTDGLANSYDFLENVLKRGKLLEYCLQWDYAIDAFPDEALSGIFPEGCFVLLPKNYVVPEFRDDLVRRLRVFRMKCLH